MQRTTPEEIDAVLPQTQCGLCGHQGCMPYAEALVYENAPINLCPPGGTRVLQKLGHLLHQDPTPYFAEMEKKTKPKMRAVIREEECIGCTKCIQACPVDAILGAAKEMHTVIADECTGCELCIAPCPVDCIDMLAFSSQPSEIEQKDQATLARERYQFKLKRIAKEKLIKKNKEETLNLQKKKNYLEAAIARARAKKNLIRPDVVE